MSYAYYHPQLIFGMQYPYNMGVQPQPQPLTYPYAMPTQYPVQYPQTAAAAAAATAAAATPYHQIYQQPATSYIAPQQMHYAHQQSPYAHQQPNAYAQYAQQQAFAQNPYAQQHIYAAGQYMQQPQYAAATAAMQPQFVQQPQLATDPFGLPQVPGDVNLQQPEVLILTEKVVSATRDSFVVQDMQGGLRYRVDGTFSLHERKSIKNVQGQTLLKLKEARMRMREKLTLFSPNDIPVMTLQQTHAIQIGTKKIHGYLGAIPQGTPALIITGNHNNTHFRMVDSQNRQVASVTRKRLSLKNMLTDQDTYEVTIQLGSPALILFIVVALDEIYED